MIIRNNKTKGFYSSDREIKIKDTTGKVFYLYKNPTGKICEFNLPKGKFLTDNKIGERAEPKKYTLPELAPFERKVKFPKRIKIYYKNNKNKCSVNLEAGEIIFDKDFRKSLSTPTFVFIICHEFGHYFYGGHNPVTEADKYKRSEMFCDTFATRLMLKNGYNPSQIVLSSRYSLSDASTERKIINENFCQHA
jgi:hypothetical protein